MTRTDAIEQATAAAGRANRRAWAAVASLSLGAFILVATEFLPIGIIPAVAEDLDVSIGTAGLMVLVPGLVAAVSAPLIVVASGRLRRDHLVYALGALLVASNIIAALAPTFAVLLFARALVGVALGGFWAVVPTLGFRLVPSGRGPRATSIIITGISVGTVIGLPAGQLIGDTMGWQAVYALAAVVAGVVLIAQIIVIPRIDATGNLRVRDLLDVLRTPAARTGLVVTATIVVAQFAASTFITPFLADIVHAEPLLVTGLFVGYGIVGIAGTLLGGTFIARSLPGTLIAATLTLGATLLLLPLTAGSVVVSGILFILWGIVWGMIPLTLQTWMITAYPSAPEAASAVLVTTLQLSIAIGALVGGLLTDGAGLRADFFIAGALAIVSAIVVVASLRQKGAR